MLDSQSMFVDKYYEMDPKFEDVLPDGNFLEEGMIVLIESPMNRADVDVEAEAFNPSLRYVARALNRWCTVTPGSLKYLNGHGEGFVSFVGTYGDGGKMKRMNNVEDAWIVKLDSLPEPK